MAHAPAHLTSLEQGPAGLLPPVLRPPRVRGCATGHGQHRTVSLVHWALGARMSPSLAQHSSLEFSTDLPSRCWRWGGARPSCPRGTWQRVAPWWHLRSLGGGVTGWVPQHTGSVWGGGCRLRQGEPRGSWTLPRGRLGSWGVECAGQVSTADPSPRLAQCH